MPHGELEREVARLKPDDLLRWIGDQRDPSLGTGLTVGALIRGLRQPPHLSPGPDRHPPPGLRTGELEYRPRGRPSLVSDQV